MDRGPQHRLRCDKGGRGSMGRLDDAMGSPTVQRMDPLLEEYKNNRTRRWEMKVGVPMADCWCSTVYNMFVGAWATACSADVV